MLNEKIYKYYSLQATLSFQVLEEFAFTSAMPFSPTLQCRSPIAIAIVLTVSFIPLFLNLHRCIQDHLQYHQQFIWC
jgi:hypothetical protein